MKERTRQKILSSFREKYDETLTYREIPVDFLKMPGSINEENRSYEATMSTENPALVLDWERFEIVNEVLLMEGARFPAQVPLLDCHNRSSIDNVKGSVREIRVENKEMVGRVHISKTEEKSWEKVREGHLTDHSIGYRVEKSTWIPEGQSQVINGRTFEGPLKVSTNWTLREFSQCPIGADELAKVRAMRSKNNNKKEGIIMDPKLREILEGKAGRKFASDEEALTFARTLETPKAPEATPAPAPKAEPVNRNEDITREERLRAAEIHSIGRQFASFVDDKFIERAIAEGQSIDAVRADVLKKVAEKNGASNPGYSGSVEVGITDGEKMRAAASDAILLRVGHKVEKPESCREFRGLTLVEMARHCLRMSGLSSHGTAYEIAGRALASTDFATLLGPVANKTLQAAFDAQPVTYTTWCAEGFRNNFQTQTLARLSQFGNVEEVPEGGEFKYLSISEGKETFKLATYGGRVQMTRQAVINDDLSAFTEKLNGMGSILRRKENQLAYAVLTANGNMGDSKALFHADHKNFKASSGATVATGLAAAELAMGVQTDDNGIGLAIPSVYYIAPLTVKTVSEAFFRSSLIGTQAQPNVVNVYADGYLTRVYDRLLDDTDDADWYLAGPKGQTVTMFFLEGMRNPRVEMQEVFSTESKEWRVGHDMAAKAVDWRALYKTVI